MAISRMLAALLLALLAAPAFAQKADFAWNWRDQEIIGHNDASLGNTSKLTEQERTALIDAIVLRLQKPMTDAGYDDDRIREIASTTRIRFVDFGGGKPLLLTTSLGMEGGCDAMGNCPLWIFRRSSGGFASLLDGVAASYTLQSPDGDLVLMHHVSQKQSGLEVYRFEDGKLNNAGCYTANWPAPSDDPTQVSDPEIVACKEGAAEPTPLTPEAKREAAPSPDAKQPLPDALQPGDAKPVSPEQKPEPGQSNPTEPQAKPGTPETKPDASPSPDAKQALPDAPQPQPGDAKPDTADQKQQPAPGSQAEPQPRPDTSDAKPDAPPPSDSKQPAPDAPAQPDSKASPEAPPQSDSKPTAPDAPQTGDAKPDSSGQQSPAQNQASPDSKQENPQPPPDQQQAPPPQSD